jgi:hypothetical protein
VSTASTVHAAGMRLSGAMRMGTPEQVAQAKRDLAVAYLERDIARANAVGVDRPTRHRLAKTLIAGAPQDGDR